MGQVRLDLGFHLKGAGGAWEGSGQRSDLIQSRSHLKGSLLWGGQATGRGQGPEVETVGCKRRPVLLDLRSHAVVVSSS